MAKEIKYGAEARKALEAGVDQLLLDTYIYVKTNFLYIIEF